MSFNPFDLRGPQFLLFYIVFAAGLITYAAVRLRKAEDGKPFSSRGTQLARDPYMIAYLRGGAKELLRIAIFGLTERKLLGFDERTVRTIRTDSPPDTPNHVDEAILRECRSGRKVEELLDSSSLQTEAEHYSLPLQTNGLIADEDEHRRRAPFSVAVVGSLIAVAVIKILVALSRGRGNIGFLVFLAVISVVIAVTVFRFRRTPAGNSLLRTQQTLFAHLRRRVTQLASQNATNEAIIVAGVYGLATLPSTRFPFARELRKNPKSQSSSDGSGCGSGSSGCGGGGGCGGCGS